MVRIKFERKGERNEIIYDFWLSNYIILFRLKTPQQAYRG